MNGSLALVGSGEYLPAMTEFEKSLVQDGVKNGKESRYIQIPTAAGRESVDRLEYWKQLGLTQAKAIGVEATYLPIYTREDAFNQKYVDSVKNSALMYMSGGDPHHLAEVLIDTPLWSAIVENWRTGASLAGCSAGAMALADHIPALRLPTHTATNGLGLLPHIRVLPHFDKMFARIPDFMTRFMKVPNGVSVVGIDEDTAIVGGPFEWEVQGRQSAWLFVDGHRKEFKSGQTLVTPKIS